MLQQEIGIGPDQLAGKRADLEVPVGGELRLRRRGRSALGRPARGFAVAEQRVAEPMRLALLAG
jgi:hypothetical protein